MTFFRKCIHLNNHHSNQYILLLVGHSTCLPVLLYQFPPLSGETIIQILLSLVGEGNGNPLLCSCLENLRDGGASWAAVYGVAQSRTRLKRLSSSSSSSIDWSCLFLTILYESSNSSVPTSIFHHNIFEMLPYQGSINLLSHFTTESFHFMSQFIYSF